MINFKLWPCVVVVFLGTLMALADPSPTPVAPVATINTWTSHVNLFMASSFAAALATLLEVVLRIAPSKQPLSIAYALDDTFKAIGGFFKAIGDALDKILPNRLSGS